MDLAINLDDKRSLETEDRISDQDMINTKLKYKKNLKIRYFHYYSAPITTPYLLTQILILLQAKTTTSNQLSTQKF